MKCIYKFFISMILISFIFSFEYRSLFAGVQRAELNIVEQKKSENKEIDKKTRKKEYTLHKVNLKLIQSIDKTIAFYKKQAAQRRKGSPDRFKLLMRLLNLHLEQSGYVANQEIRAYDKAYDRWEAHGSKGKAPELHTDKSRKHWDGVMNLATSIMKEYPRNPEGARIMEINGIAHYNSNKQEEAARIFTQLIQKYPKANEAGTAYYYLGEFYYERNDFRNASANYTKALKFPRMERYGDTLYQLGWCAYNMNNSSKALTYWKKAVAYGKGKNDRNIIERTLVDMVFAFADLKDVNGAIAYFRANSSGNLTGKLFKNLADTLRNNGEYKEARRVYKLLQQYAPNSEKAPEAQSEVVDLDYQMQNYTSMWKELELFSKLYNPNSNWARVNSKNKELILSTRELVKEKIAYYTKVLAIRARKTEDAKLYKQALFGCHMYLHYFSGAKEAIEMKEIAADINYNLKNYREAGKLYLEIVSLPPKKAIVINPSNGKVTNIHKKSADNMIEAYGDDFKPYFAKMEKMHPDFTKPPKPIPVQARNYIKACDKYTGLYPKEAKVVFTCEKYTASIYHTHGDKVNATKYLTLMALKYPKKKEGKEAAEQLIVMNKDDPVKCVDIATKLLKIPEYATGDLGKKLRAVLIGSEKQAADQEKDSEKRAKKYEALAKKYPNDPEADRMWHNAGAEYLKIGNVPAAVGAFMTLIKKYPDSKAAEEDLMQIALIYRNRLDFMEASKYFTLYAKKYPKSSKALGALATACDLEIAFEAASAVKTCQEGIIKADPSNPAYMEKLILLSDRTKKYSQMASLIKTYLAKYKLSSNDRIIAFNRVYTADPKSQAGRSAASSILSEYNKNKKSVSGEAQRYAVGILFNNAGASVAPFSKAKLVGGTVEKLMASMENKAKLLNNIVAAYNKVVETGDSYWGVGALHQMGAAFEEYAKALSNPPAIKGASKEDVLKELKPQIEGFTKEAIGYYTKASDIVSKFNVYNDWSIRVVNSRNRILNSSVRLNDYVFLPDFVSSEVPSSVVSSM